MAIVVLGCQEPVQVQVVTGNEVTYELVQGTAEYNVSGTVTLKERTDGFTNVHVQLSGTSGDAEHPVHLHLGTIAMADAEVAAMLSPVSASTGLSVTNLRELADNTPVRYEELIRLRACVKVHLSESGPGRNVVLAAGNIGTAYNEAISGGRQSGIAVCRSN